MSQAAIEVRGIGKEYQLGLREKASQTFREAIVSAAKAPLRRLRHLSGRADRVDTFWALRDISFDVQVGEIIGIIGRNGAGKSTLLKILSRITQPTTGKAEISGRIASLLEVGTGFHTELTGRENIFLNGAILGMLRAEIIRKFDEIVEFAGVEKFIDTPIKHYSSGMTVRLAFAVAAHLDPEILVVDEVLAVGDAQFQRKCLGKMGSVAREGRTILFVSHNMGAVSQLCSTAIWLDEGRLREIGRTSELISRYLHSGTDADTVAIRSFAEDTSKPAQLREVRFVTPEGEATRQFDCDYPVTIQLELQVRAGLGGLYAYMEIQRVDGMVVLMSDSFDTVPNPLDDLPVGTHLVTVTIPARTLGHGEYMVYLNLTSRNADRFNVDSPGVVGTFRLDDFTSRRGNNRPGCMSTLPEWNLVSESAVRN